MSTKTMTDHIEMMETPDLWPLKWRLPLMRNREMGVLLLDVEPRWTVFMPIEYGIFDGRLAFIQAAGKAPNMADALPLLPFKTYIDAEGVYDAGWRVD